MRSRSTRIISEVEKVWQRVMSIWYRSGNRAERIPSSNELAEEFGIARSSVRIALERLTAAGFLVTRKGSGTFVNPKRCLDPALESPLVGLLISSGDYFYYPPVIQAELECFYGVLRNSGWNVREVTGHMGCFEDACQVIKYSYLDGIITFGSSQFAVMASKSMLPTVNMGGYVPGVCNVVTGCTSVLRELFGIAGRDSGINVWTTMPESMPEYLLWHLQRHPGVRITRGHYRPHADGDSYFSRLRGQFASECPDWLLTTPEERGRIREIIISLYGVEKARSLLWVDLIEPGKDRGWPAYFFHSRRREEVQAAIDLLAPRLAGGGHDGEEARDVVVEAELVKI